MINNINMSNSVSMRGGITKKFLPVELFTQKTNNQTKETALKKEMQSFIDRSTAINAKIAEIKSKIASAQKNNLEVDINLYEQLDLYSKRLKADIMYYQLVKAEILNPTPKVHFSKIFK